MVRSGRRLWLFLAIVALGRLCWKPIKPCYSVPVQFGSGYKLKEDKILGTGAFGSVYEVQDQGGTGRAVKVIPMWRMQLDNNRETMRAKLEHEIDVHRHIGQHPNIVQLVDSVDIEGDVAGWPRWKMIVLELAKGGELSDLVQSEGKLSEAKAKHIFQQVVTATQHLHTRQVIHRDLKLDNILLCSDGTQQPDKPMVKLIDFGAGYWAKQGPLEAFGCVGTLETMAPEVILSRGDDFDAVDLTQVENTHRVEFRVRPFGIRKYAPGPGGKGARVVDMIVEERYKGDPLGQAWKKGVQTGWVVQCVGGIDVRNMKFDDILDLMGDRLLDNSSRGAFDGSFKVTGDNKGKGKVLPKVQMMETPLSVEYVELKNRPYDAKVDVWSLGVIAYNMVMGKAPFPVDEAAILTGNYDPPVGASPEFADLISKMLVIDAEKRFSLAEVAAHPWLTSAR